MQDEKLLKNRPLHRSVRKFLTSLMSGDPRLASSKLESLRMELRQRCRGDLWFLCYSILAMRDINTKLHRELCRQWHKREKREYTMWQLPRSHFKTSIMVVGDTIRVGLCDPNLTQLIVSAKLDNVSSMLHEIKVHFETNEILRWLFPEYCPDLVDREARKRAHWTTERLSWPCRTRWVREASIEIMSVGASMVSKHFDYLRFDDAVNDENSETMESCNSVYRWFRNSWQLRILHKKCYIRVTGTPWHFADFYTQEIEREKRRRQKGEEPDLILYKKPCYDGEGEPIAPTVMNRADLELTLARIGPYQFACNYMLNPVPEGTAIFKRDQINRCHRLEVPSSLVHFIAVDMSEEDSDTPDHTAIVVVGIDERGKWYVRHITRGKYHPLSLMETIAGLAHKYEAQLVGVETTAFQKTIYKEFLRWSHDNRVQVPWVELKRGKQHKNKRIRALQPILFRGDFWVVDDVDHYEVLEEELLTFDRGRSDDIIDSLASIQELYYDAPKSYSDSREKVSINGLYGELHKLDEQENRESQWTEDIWSEDYEDQDLELLELVI